jgi:hypothetical protein
MTQTMATTVVLMTLETYLVMLKTAYKTLTTRLKMRTTPK